MYRRNEQFLKATQMQSCHGTKHRHPSDCGNTCHTNKPSNPCQCKDTCSRDKCCDSCTCDVCKNRNTPETIIDVLCDLINERIQVTVPFGVITGTLLDVKCDYIIMLEDTGALVLVRTRSIESVNPIT